MVHNYFLVIQLWSSTWKKFTVSLDCLQVNPSPGFSKELKEVEGSPKCPRVSANCSTFALRLVSGCSWLCSRDSMKFETCRVGLGHFTRLLSIIIPINSMMKPPKKYEMCHLGLVLGFCLNIHLISNQKSFRLWNCVGDRRTQMEWWRSTHSDNFIPTLTGHAKSLIVPLCWGWLDQIMTRSNSPLRW